MKCPEGLSLSFWMKFEGGDYILTSGGYAEGRNVTSDFLKAIFHKFHLVHS